MKNTFAIFLWIFLATSLTNLTACGPITLDMGPEKPNPNKTNPPDYTRPSFETFESSVQSFMTDNSCHDCHAVGFGDYTLVPDTEESQRRANYQQTICSPRLEDFDTPKGAFLSRFCSGPGEPHEYGHEGKFATDKDCTAFFEWVSEGTGSSPTACSNET